MSVGELWRHIETGNYCLVTEINDTTITYRSLNENNKILSMELFDWNDPMIISNYIWPRYFKICDSSVSDCLLEYNDDADEKIKNKLDELIQLVKKTVPDNTIEFTIRQYDILRNMMITRTLNPYDSYKNIIPFDCVCILCTEFIKQNKAWFIPHQHKLEVSEDSRPRIVWTPAHE
jgi:hypothetical protein